MSEDSMWNPEDDITKLKKVTSVGGDITGGLGSLASVWNSIDNSIMERKKLAQAKSQFDRQFAENARQFGLEFALKDYATRKGIALNTAQTMLNVEQQKNQNAMTSENIKTSALGRGIQQKQFDWQKEDRTKNAAFKKALQKGIVSGILGG